jgi:hypothetical protein
MIPGSAFCFSRLSPQSFHGVVTVSSGCRHSSPPSLHLLDVSGFLLLCVCVLMMSQRRHLSFCRHIHTPASSSHVCGCATPRCTSSVLPPPAPRNLSNVRCSPAIPNALSCPHCPPRALFFCAGRNLPSPAHQLTLVLCRLLFESQTSPNRLLFVNIRFWFDPK